MPAPCNEEQQHSTTNDMFYTTNMPLPPPPPQYNDSRPLCEIEADLCRKLSCGGQCHSQDSLNSGYSGANLDSYRNSRLSVTAKLKRQPAGVPVSGVLKHLINI